MSAAVTVEASDIVKLLRELGQTDPTCRAMAEWADHASTPILEVCHEAVTRLAAEKARLAAVVEQMLGTLPPEASFGGQGDQASYDGGPHTP